MLDFLIQACQTMSEAFDFSSLNSGSAFGLSKHRHYKLFMSLSFYVRNLFCLEFVLFGFEVNGNYSKTCTVKHTLYLKCCLISDGISVSPAKWTKRKHRPMENLQSMVVLLRQLLDSLNAYIKGDENKVSLLFCL